MTPILPGGHLSPTPHPQDLSGCPWLPQPGSCVLPTGPSDARMTESACGSGASVMALTTVVMGLTRKTVVS